MGQETTENELVLHSILSNIPDIIYRLDSEGCISFVNAAVEKYGYKQEELIGTHILDWVHPDDRPEALHRINERRTGNRRTTSLEVRLLNKIDSNEVDKKPSETIHKDSIFHITAEGLYHSNQVKTKHFRGTQGVARYVTETRPVRNVNKQQSGFLHSMIESIHHPFYVVNAHNYKITFANTAAKLDRTLNQSTCYALSVGGKKPCETDGNPCPVDIIKKTKKPVTVEHVQDDGEGNTKYYEIRAYPIFNDSGEVTQVIESSIDITDRKQMENALIDSEMKFRAVAQSANDAIISVNQENCVVFWNEAAEKMFGYKKAEILGKSLTMIMPEEFRETHLKSLERNLLTDESTVIGQTVELSGLRKDKTEFPLELSLAEWKAAKKKFYTGIIRDISKRKQMEQDRENIIDELQAALGKVKTLSGLIPICASCKRIRDDKGYWNIIEAYIKEHSDAEFSHGICPECSEKLYSKYLKKGDSASKNKKKAPLM